MAPPYQPRAHRYEHRAGQVHGTWEERISMSQAGQRVVAPDHAAGPVHEDAADEPKGIVIGEDGLGRCPWATSPQLYVEYHDTEWGMPVYGEQPLFERIMLEAFQAGLSWLTILRKRPAFRDAFADFDPEVVARFSDADLDRLMQDAGIVRNRQKILAARTNARAVIALRQEGGLDAFIWSRKPDTTPAPETIADVPAQTPESKALSRELKSRGFVFVGPTTVHALMEAIGMVDAHLVGCHRRGSSGLHGAMHGT
jgi:DNA-3-methyladenine glycosylase I